MQEKAQLHERLVHSARTSSKFETQTTKFGKKPDFKKSPKPSESAFSSNDNKTRTVQTTIGPANCMQDKGKLLTIHRQNKLEIGTSVYNVQEMKAKYPYLKCVGFKQIDMKKVAIILGQNAYELIRPVEYKNGGENKPWAIRLPLGWTVSGPVPINQLKLNAACHVANNDDMKLAEVVKKWWDMESYGTLKVDDKRTKKRQTSHRDSKLNDQIQR